MATITYKVKNGTKKIYCSVVEGRIQNGGFQLRKSIGKEINNPSNWIKNKQQVRKCKEEPSAPYINNFLVKHKSHIVKGIDELVNQNRPVNKENVCTIIDSFGNSVQSKRDSNKFSLTKHIQDLVELMISGKKLNKGERFSKDTIKGYKTLIQRIEEFEEFKGIIKPHLVDSKLYDSLINFFSDESEKEYSPNYVGSIIKRFKAVINNYLIEDLNIKFPNYNPNKWTKPTNETLKTYLTLNQIYTLINLDLTNYPKDYDNVRDVYCFNALTCGVRVGDYLQFKKHNLITKMVNGERQHFLEFRQSKTSSKVRTPIGKTALSIIDKHNGFPKIQSAQKSNDILKELGELCGFDSVCILEDKNGKIIKQRKQYELMTNHSARRSFCTNAWSKGTDLLEIMNISGHKTPAVLLKYIDKTLEEYAERMMETAYFKAVDNLDETVNLRAV